jgi:membrane-bound serine protease (ClpP class)
MPAVTPSTRGRPGIGRVLAVAGLLCLAAGPQLLAGDERPKSFSKAVIIPITDDINDVTLSSMMRRLESARQEGVDLVILEMDTPGGLVSSALDICRELKNLDDMHSVAWINPSAYSAGAMISLACDEIVVARRSTIGDCQPILFTGTGAADVPEGLKAKLTSPVLEEFRDSARMRGYNLLMCEAMIVPEIEVYWVENTETGERRFVRPEDRDRLFKLPAETKPGDDKNDEGHDQYVSDEASSSSWRYVKNVEGLGQVTQPIVKSTELLTMTQDEAIAYGFATAKLSTLRELKEHFGLPAEPVRLDYTWSEELTEFLCSPIVRGILFLLMLLGAYVEFHTPGVGLPGAAALACLALFLGAPYLTGLADVWEVLLVVVGVGLILVEIFVIPGFGVAGISGILLVLVGLVATFVPSEPGPNYLPRMPATWEGIRTGLTVVLGATAIGTLGMWILAKYLPKVPILGRLVLSVEPQAIVNATVAASVIEQTPVIVGQRGQALTALHPAGKASIEGQRVDVITQGEMVAKGSRVQVVEVAGSRVVVREVHET